MHGSSRASKRRPRKLSPQPGKLLAEQMGMHPQTASLRAGAIVLVFAAVGCGPAAETPPVDEDKATSPAPDAGSPADDARPLGLATPPSNACPSGRCSSVDAAVAPTPTPEAEDAGAVDLSRGDSGMPGWASSFGVTGYTEALAVALDPTNGDIALAGYTSGSANLGGGVIAGGAFVARFASGGAYKWAHLFPSGGVTVDSVAVDGAGDVLVSGAFFGTADFGGGAVALTGPYEDIFLAEYDSSGGFRWLQHASAVATAPEDNPGSPTAFPASFNQVVFDASGDIYCVGSSHGSAVDLGCGAMPTGAGEFIAELDSTGACAWSHAYGTSESFQDYPLNIALDGAGNVLVAGGLFGTVDFGTGAMSDSYGDADPLVFVQKLGANGATLWANSFGPGAVYGLGTDANGNILMAGYSALGKTGNFDTFFVQKADPTGSSVWSKTFAGGNLTGGSANGLVVSAAGEPIVTGTFDSTVDLGGGPLNATPLPPTGDNCGSCGVFVAKLSATGAYEWAFSPGPTGATQVGTLRAGGIAANATAVVTAGQFTGTLTFPGNTLTSVGTDGNAYLASFRP